MNSDEIRSQLKSIIADHLELDPQQLESNASFSKELGLDSLDAMDMLMVVDESFKIRIPPQEMEDIDNFDQLISVVKKHLK